MVQWGAGPRAGIALVTSAKARAILQGRIHVTTGDIAAVAPPVLRHRVVTTFNADASGISRDDIVQQLLQEIRPERPVDQVSSPTVLPSQSSHENTKNA
jgi:MoxR-like ATPase